MYKNKYLIGIYAPVEEGETLLGLCDNITEFADFMEIKYDNAKKILNQLFNKQTSFIRFFGKVCSVEFIKM